MRDREAAERELGTFSSDLALVFEPVHLVDFEVLTAVPQPVFAMMARNHPLAAKNPLRLRDCLSELHVLPTAPYGVRYIIDRATQRSSMRPKPVVECDSFEFARHYVLHEGAIGFQIPVGLDPQPDRDLVVRRVSERDVPPGHLLLGQLRRRTLPVASAQFAIQLATALAANAEQAVALAG